MTAPTAPVHDYSHAGPSLADYTSMMLQMYFETLGQYSTAQVLDVGPVCEVFSLLSIINYCSEPIWSQTMSKSYPECPLYNHNNCKHLHNPKICAISRDDNVCGRKRNKSGKKSNESNGNN